MRARYWVLVILVGGQACLTPSRMAAPDGQDSEAQGRRSKSYRSGEKKEGAAREEGRSDGVVIEFSDRAIEGELRVPEGSPPQPLSTLKIVNDAPYPDMFFKNYGVNPTLDTTEHGTSTFSVDVDTGSYTLARSYLQRGHLPNPDGIRVEEFINAFDYHYTPPSEEPFSVSMEVYPSPYRNGYHVLQLGLKGRVVSAEQRKPANLVFVVDTSGSMAGPARLGLVKHALGLLVHELTEADSVGIVAYGSDAYQVLPPTTGADKPRILDALARLDTSGSTNAQAGLLLGYRMAATRVARGTTSRVILCSDGVANNGIATTADGIFRTVKSEAARGIMLTTVGFGMGNYNDVLLERLADQGDGFYAYVDEPREAERIFVESLNGTLEVIAKDVKVQVEFNPEAVSRYRLLGYENRHLEKEDFANDKVDAGEIGAGHSVTALYEVKLKEGNAALGVLRLRHKAPDGGASVPREWALPRTLVRTSVAETSAASKLALISAGFAEKLRQSYWARNLSYGQLLQMYAQLPPDVATDPRVMELKRLIQTARGLDDRKDRFEIIAPVAHMDFDTLPVLK